MPRGGARPHSGEILALVAVPDISTPPFSVRWIWRPPPVNRILVQAVIYAQALDPHQLGPWTAATAIMDVTTTSSPRRCASCPKNYDGREHGTGLGAAGAGFVAQRPAVITLDKVGIGEHHQPGAAAGHHLARKTADYDCHWPSVVGRSACCNCPRPMRPLPTRHFHRQYRHLGGARRRRNLLYTRNAPSHCNLRPRVTWLISDILSDDWAAPSASA